MILPQVTRPLLATVFFAGITTFSSKAGSLGPLIYSDNGTSITIIDCSTNTSGAVVVPSHIDGKPVTTIGDSAFYYCSKITSVTLPESVTTLGEFSFYNCKALANINLPEGISVLESGTFSRCAELKSITIPSTVTMTYGAFYNSGLEQATIAGGSETIAGGLFWGCRNLSKVTVPPSVKTIGAKAFQECSALRDFPAFKSITSIGESAFASSGLRSASLPKKLTSLGEGAFAGSALEEIKLPSNLKVIPRQLLAYCRSLKSIRIPDSVTSIGVQAFRGSGLVTVSIPPSVRTIEQAAFNFCQNLNSAKFSGKAPTLGSAVFGGTANGFTIFLEDGSTGFTLPRWRGNRTSLPRPEILVRSSTRNFDLQSGFTENFKAALPGAASTFRTFTITNTGIRPLTNLNVYLKTPSQFSVKKPKIKSLAPGKSIDLKVWFNPQVSGNQKAQISILSNDANENPFIINVRGFVLTEN